MISLKLQYTIHDSILDPNGRYVILDITLYDQRVTFVCVYGHNSDEPYFLIRFCRLYAG